MKATKPSWSIGGKLSFPYATVHTCSRVSAHQAPVTWLSYKTSR